MRTNRNTLSALAAIGTLMGVGYTQGAEIEGELHAGYQSMYEFRGVDRGDDRVTAGVDLGYDLPCDFRLVGGVLYGSTNDDSDSLIASNDELDLYLGLNRKFDKWTIEGGYIFYHYFDEDSAPASLTSPADDQQEVYLSLGYELPYEFQVSLSYFYEFDQIDGGYTELQLSRNFALSECVGLRVAVGAAYSSGYNYDRDGTRDAGRPVELNGMNHYFAELSVPWEIREGVTLTPFVKATFADDDLVTSATLRESQDFFVGGASISIEF